jgi:hypothetical protein
LDVNTGRVVTQAFSFRDQCVANVSLITIAGDLGFVNQTQVNVTKLAFDQIDVVDFSSLTSSFNLSQSLSLSNSPTAQLNNLLNLNTSELSASGFDTLNSSLAGVITTLNTLKTSMATARAATAPTKVFTLSGGVTFGQADADFIARSTAIDTTIDSIIASIETFRTTTISNLKTSIDGLRTSADGLKTNALTVPTYYDAAMVGITTFSTNASNNVFLINDS